MKSEYVKINSNHAVTENLLITYNTVIKKARNSMVLHCLKIVKNCEEIPPKYLKLTV